MIVFGKCPSTAPLTAFRKVISGAVGAGAPFVNFTVQDWLSPEINWTSPGVVYVLRMRIGFAPSAAVDWFWAAHQFNLCFRAADEGLYLDPAHPNFGFSHERELPALAEPGLAGDPGAYGFMAVPFEAGDPPDCVPGGYGWIGTPFVIATIDQLGNALYDKIISSSINATLPGPAYYYSKPFHRSQLSLTVFEGVQYLCTGAVSLWFFTNPCGDLYDAPLVIRSAIYKDSAYEVIGPEFPAPGDRPGLGVLSYLLLEFQNDPNKDSNVVFS